MRTRRPLWLAVATVATVIGGGIFGAGLLMIALLGWGPDLPKTAMVIGIGLMVWAERLEWMFHRFPS